MGRAKLKLVEIKNEAKRKAMFNHRYKSLSKKCHELSTLCAVKVATIVYPPSRPGDHCGTAIAEIWPPSCSAPSEFRSLFAKLKKHRRDESIDTGGSKDFSEDRKRKADTELTRAKKKNSAEAKYPTWDPSFDGFSETELRELVCLLDARLDAAKARLAALDQSHNVVGGTVVVHDQNQQ